MTLGNKEKFEQNLQNKFLESITIRVREWSVPFLASEFSGEGSDDYRD